MEAAIIWQMMSEMSRILMMTVTHAQSLPRKNYRGLFLKGRKTCRLLNHFSPPPSSCFSWVVNSNQFTVWLFQGVKTSTFHLHKQYDSFKHPLKLIPLKVLCGPSRKKKTNHPLLIWNLWCFFCEKGFTHNSHCLHPFPPLAENTSAPLLLARMQTHTHTHADAHRHTHCIIYKA